MRQQETAAERDAWLGQRGCSEGPTFYRTRDPRATSLYCLVEKHYDTVKGLWEERFEARYGFWRGFVDAAVNRYLDCGIMELGCVVTDYIPLSTFGAGSNSGDSTPSSTRR